MLRTGLASSLARMEPVTRGDCKTNSLRFDRPASHIKSSSVAFKSPKTKDSRASLQKYVSLAPIADHAGGTGVLTAQRPESESVRLTFPSATIARRWLL